MKLVFCIDELKNSGGMERILCNRINYLIEEFKYDVYVITTDNNNNKNKNKDFFFELNDKVKIIDLGINYHNYTKYNFKVIKKIEFIIKRKLHLKKLNKIINKIKPDILTSMGDRSRSINCKIHYNCKKILENHFSKENYTANEGNSFLCRLKRFINGELETNELLKKYDKFIVLTEKDKIDWNIQGNKIEVVENMLSFESKKISNLENKKVISVGRLMWQKGYDLLIDAWSIVNRKYPDWILEVYGEGNQKNFLQEKIDKLELGKVLKLKGSTNKIEEKLLESAIYVMSSRSEAFGLVLIEAEHCGLPLVSFDLCGPSSIIKDGKNGFLCESENINKLAEKIMILIENEKLRKNMGKKARNDSYKYSKKNIMKRWKKIYEELL